MDVYENQDANKSLKKGRSSPLSNRKEGLFIVIEPVNVYSDRMMDETN